jgi:hypothetical protein
MHSKSVVAGMNCPFPNSHRLTKFECAICTLVDSTEWPWTDTSVAGVWGAQWLQDALSGRQTQSFSVSRSLSISDPGFDEKYVDAGDA